MKHQYTVQAVEGPQYVRTEPATVFYKAEYGSGDVQVGRKLLSAAVLFARWGELAFLTIALNVEQRTKSSVLQLLVLTTTMKYQRAALRMVSCDRLRMHLTWRQFLLSLSCIPKFC